MTDGRSVELEQRVAGFIEVLTRFASGDWEARAPRDHGGDPLDVLAFMINAAIEEIGHLVVEQQRQREELERTQAQLVHAGKLVALGELAGGIAHELNQPLSALSGLIGLGLVDRNALDTEDLKLMSEATLRMSRIVDGVRLFARRTDLRKEPIDPMDPVRAAAGLVERRLEADGHALEVVAAAPGTIVGDRDRLQQVLVNLLVNAADAVDQARPREGHIRVEGRWIGDGFEYIVEDDGPGVPEQDRDRIFEPFFTTKEVGQGTGLGLSLSYGIIRDHGGEMMLDESADRGARFRVRLPRGSTPMASSSRGGGSR